MEDLLQDSDGQSNEAEPRSSSSLTSVRQDKKKVAKPGIVYLSTVPPKMNVTQIREHFAMFGEIHRSFLQPDKKKQKKGSKNLVFTEGWIEFKKRRHAKKVAEKLNNTPLGGKKKHQNYDFLWNVKYLPGLQWVHINERLAYERISRQQKMRAEVAAAKRETSFFAKSVSLNKTLKKKSKLKAEFSQPDEVKAEPEEDSKHSKKSKPQKPENTNDVNTATSSTNVSKSRLKLFQAFFPDQ